jgi:TetR/AcrR family transcriptional regulator
LITTSEETLRLSSTERQEQIVQAALDLLAEHSVDRLTTRRVAKRVGISQPALFRHFASREEILIAVLDHVRASLGSEATRILAAGHTPREAVHELMAALLTYVSAHPGMPRLLFYDAATSADDSEDSTLRPRLRQLLDMQRALVGELLTGAQAAGQLPAGVDPAPAARLLLTLIQGRILAMHLAGESRMEAAELAALLDFYWAGLEAYARPACGGPLPGALAAQPGEAGSEVAQSSPAPTESLIHFDAREDLSQGRDPFEGIRARLARLRPEGLLVLDVPFLPEPLLALLDSEGWTCEVEASEGNQQVRILGPQASAILDVRDLEPPEPMVAILEGASSLAPQQVLLARLPRVPRLLLPRLAERGLEVVYIEVRDDGVYLALHLPDGAEAGVGLQGDSRSEVQP